MIARKFEITGKGLAEARKKVKLFLTAYWRPYRVLVVMARKRQTAWTPATLHSAVAREFGTHATRDPAYVLGVLLDYEKKGWVREIG